MKSIGVRIRSRTKRSKGSRSINSSGQRFQLQAIPVSLRIDTLVSGPGFTMNGRLG